MKNLHLITKKIIHLTAFEYIQLKDGFFNVTNDHTALIVPQLEVFPESVLNQLPKECYFLGENWKSAKVSKGFNFKINGTSIEVYDNKDKALGFCPFITEIENAKYPNILQATPPENALQETNCISVNPELLNQVYEANNRDIMRMQFTGEGKAVRITFLNSEAVGVIMPLRFEK
jgi:hypothetical protein